MGSVPDEEEEHHYEPLSELACADRDVLAIFVADMDGAVIARTLRPGFAAPSAGPMSGVAAALDQAGRLGRGRARRLMAWHVDTVRVHFGRDEWIASVWLRRGGNVGAVLGMEAELEAVAKQLVEGVRANGPAAGPSGSSPRPVQV